MKCMLAIAAILVVGGACAAGASPSASSVVSAQPSVVVSAVPSTVTSATPSAEPSIKPSGGPTGRTVTVADDGSTLDLAVGDQFLLNLGPEFDWTVSVGDQSVLSRVPYVAVIAGAQGVFEALSPGRTMLTATGDPPCRKSTPACAAPSRLFRIDVVVHP